MLDFRQAHRLAAVHEGHGYLVAYPLSARGAEDVHRVIVAHADAPFGEGEHAHARPRESAFVAVEARVDVAGAEGEPSLQQRAGALVDVGEVHRLAGFFQHADKDVQAVIHLGHPRESLFGSAADAVFVHVHF